MTILSPFPRINAAMLLLAAAFAAAPAHARELILSADPMVQARAAMERNDPAEALSRYLRVLSAHPRDLEALIGAGRAALEIGDPRSAIAFYARAEEIAPGNGEAKAGLGSAMLQMEKPKAALKLFEEAEDLGMPPGEIAADRGLAHDLRGDNRKAQQEYLIALRTRDDPETVRRLALSLAMSGDREGALARLDPLLRKQDVPAWRVRAFVMALTGDAAGAEKTALAVLPQPQATALIPFLSRLPRLKPQQQAAAVHFGHFPSDGRRYSEAELLAGASPVERPDSALTPSGAPLGRGDGAGTASGAGEPLSTAPRRRPGAAENVLILPARPEKRDPEASSTATREAESRPASRTTAKLELKPKEADGSKPAATAKNPKEKDEPKVEGKHKDKDLLAAKSNDAKAKDAAKPKDDDKARPDAKGKGKEKEKAKTPERYWVQVAGGANKADLPKAFAKLKEQSPKLLGGRSAWTTPLRATNRLLIGPFKTSKEAQDFVNLAARDSLSAFTYTSPAGQEVEKLAAK